MGRNIVIATVIALVATTTVAALLLGGRGAADDHQTGDMAKGRQLYLENCAACHGNALEGQPNWRERLPNGRMPAPPHDETGHTWHHSDDQLFRITRDGVAAIVGGNFESDMPAFGDTMTDDDIWAVLDYIKSTWPERERDYQAQRSEQDR
ncbi:c-type cytochrome [Pelagibacterium luteolum]|uniref:Cytochrome c, mono-and diheme variants n=1 Tax=Pelagibacterium luteolum TaxID=440168 RepID=A0A1G8A8Z5_9HYPH|nr:cytochrome c [Pelagibacterium luteolum]SDH17422.1 Cytochrome c, mono-and diheme variants [Pelagibacterium luteolum]